MNTFTVEDLSGEELNAHLINVFDAIMRNPPNIYRIQHIDWKRINDIAGYLGDTRTGKLSEFLTNIEKEALYSQESGKPTENPIIEFLTYFQSLNPSPKRIMRETRVMDILAVISDRNHEFFHIVDSDDLTKLPSSTRDRALVAWSIHLLRILRQYPYVGGLKPATITDSEYAAQRVFCGWTIVHPQEIDRAYYFIRYARIWMSSHVTRPVHSITATAISYFSVADRQTFCQHSKSP